jgi:hypothetical protein
VTLSDAPNGSGSPNVAFPENRLWLTDTDDVDEINVHIAPYGDDQLAVIWNAVDNLDCERATGTCFGGYAGTYLQLFGLDGAPASQPVLIPAPPTSEQDFVIYDNGDLAFAFVTDSPDYSDRLDNISEALPLPMRTIKIAHLLYCEDEPLDLL